MRDSVFELEENRQIAKNTYLMKLSGPVPEPPLPGQFVSILLPGFYLRRPFSLCDWSEDTLTIVYKTVGSGTNAMTRLSPGTGLQVLTGLGNGFDLSSAGTRPLLVGGGAGVAPMYGLAKALAGLAVPFTAVLGFNSRDEIFMREEFQALSSRVLVTTLDGSFGLCGFVTAGMREVSDYSYVYCCGPEPMLKAVYDASCTDGQYSFEARMACGYGACVGCSRRTRTGLKRICRDGPVLFKEEILW